MYVFSLSIRSEDDYSEEEEEEDDEEEEEYDGEIPQPELEPRSRRCLVGDAGVCVISGGNSSEEEEDEDEEEEEEEEHDMRGEDSDSDGPVLYKDEDSDEDEEDEPPPSKNIHIFRMVSSFSSLFLCFFTPDHTSAWLISRRPGQQSQEEGHLSSEAEQPSLCPREGQVHPGEEQQRRPATRTDRAHLAEQGAVGGHPHTDRHCTHKVKIELITHFVHIPFLLYLLNQQE